MKAKPYLLFILVGLASLVLAACASAGNPFALAGSTWKLVSYGPVSSPTPAVGGKDTHLTFDEQRRLSGNMGCNAFGADVKLDGDRMIFGTVMSTMMACPGQVMEQEQTVLQIIHVEATFQLDGDNLTITSKDGTVSATFIRAGK